MLAAIAIQLGEMLADRGVPYPVVYGPERMSHGSATTPHVTVERSRALGDSTRPNKTIRDNPRVVFVRSIGAVCRVYARSTQSGAAPADHERVADAVVDQILVCLRTIAGGRRTIFESRDGRFLSAVDLDERGLQAWAGVVYELPFTIARGVTDGVYAGESALAYGTTPAAAEATAGGEHGFGVAITLDVGESSGSSETLPGATTRVDP